MNTIKKTISLMACIMLVLGIMMPGLAFAGERTTQVTIHKIASEDTLTAKDHHGTEITPDSAEWEKRFGEKAKALKDVEFTYFQVSAKEYKALVKAQPKTVAAVKAIAKKSEAHNLALTDGNGEVTESFKDGYYWFIETKKPETVSDSIAVPFGLILPMTNEDGTAYMDKVHVYPKNKIGELPTPEKDVTTVGNKLTSYDMDKIFPWIIKTDVPANLENYTKYEISDTLDTKLDMVSTNDTLKIYIADKKDLTEGLTLEDMAKSSKFVDANDKFNINITDRTMKLELKKNDEGKFVNLGKDKKFVVILESKINNTAILGQDILNNVKLTFRNNPDLTDDVTTEIPPTEQPKVWTGGKRFVKVKHDILGNTVQEGGKTVTLEGAEFVIMNGEKTMYLNQNNGKNEWTNDFDKASKFVTDKKGEFEVKGLAAEKDGDKTYYYKEVKAPEGYAIVTTPQKFVVNRTSYFKNPKEIDLGKLQAADSQEIGNKKLSLPQTGGPGSVMLLVAGIVVMVVAAAGLKKKQNS